MSQKKAKLYRRLTNLKSLTKEQQIQFEKLFKKEREKGKMSLPANIPVSKKRHAGESPDKFRERRQKSNKRRRNREKENSKTMVE